MSKQQQPNEPEELLQLVSFHLGNEEFAVDILKVQEINKMTSVTKIPSSPNFIEGVINLRGRIISVIDLRTRLNLPKKEYNKETRIIVVNLDGQVVGFVVDAVNEVIRIPANTTEVPPDLVGSIDSEFIMSVGKLEDRLLILIDLNKVITFKEKNDSLS